MGNLVSIILNDSYLIQSPVVQLCNSRPGNIYDTLSPKKVFCWTIHLVTTLIGQFYRLLCCRNQKWNLMELLTENFLESYFETHSRYFTSGTHPKRWNRACPLVSSRSYPAGALVWLSTGFEPTTLFRTKIGDMWTCEKKWPKNFHSSSHSRFTGLFSVSAVFTFIRLSLYTLQWFPVSSVRQEK